MRNQVSQASNTKCTIHTTIFMHFLLLASNHPLFKRGKHLLSVTFFLHTMWTHPCYWKHTTGSHMQRVLPLSEVCTPPGDSPQCGRNPPISAAPTPWERAPRASASPASRNPADASHSACPQNRGDRRSGPRHRSAQKQSREGCSDRAGTPDARHPTSSSAGPITAQRGEGIQSDENKTLKKVGEEEDNNKVY